MADVLVIGGTGFVGSAVVRHCLVKQHAVTLLNRGSRRIEGAHQLVADRNDGEALSAALHGERFDVVIDTNCYTPAQARGLIDVITGSAPRVVAISSASVYADAAFQPPRESEPIGGASVWGDYGRDKSAMEDVYRASAARFDYCGLVRPPYIFGPGNSSDRETWFWTRQLRGEAVILPGDGETQAHFVHADDLAAAIEMLARGQRRGLDIFNVADPRALRFSELASLLAQVAGAEDLQWAAGDLARDIPARAWFPFRDYPCLTDPAKLLAETDWRPAASLKDRFAETFSAYDPTALRAGFRPTPAEQALIRAHSSTP